MKLDINFLASLKKHHSDFKNFVVFHVLYCVLKYQHATNCSAWYRCRFLESWKVARLWDIEKWNHFDNQIIFPWTKSTELLSLNEHSSCFQVHILCILYSIWWNLYETVEKSLITGLFSLNIDRFHVNQKPPSPFSPFT